MIVPSVTISVIIKSAGTKSAALLFSAALKAPVSAVTKAQVSAVTKAPVSAGAKAPALKALIAPLCTYYTSKFKVNVMIILKHYSKLFDLCND